MVNHKRSTNIFQLFSQVKKLIRVFQYISSHPKVLIKYNRMQRGVKATTVHSKGKQHASNIKLNR